MRADQPCRARPDRWRPLSRAYGAAAYWTPQRRLARRRGRRSRPVAMILRTCGLPHPGHQPGIWEALPQTKGSGERGLAFPHRFAHPVGVTRLGEPGEAALARRRGRLDDDAFADDLPAEHPEFEF